MRYTLWMQCAIAILATNGNTIQYDTSCDSPTSYSGPDGSSIVLEGHCTDKAGNVGKGSVTTHDKHPRTCNNKECY
jgi:hypothetical protein